MAVIDDTTHRRGRHRALAEPDMEGRARHHRAAPRRPGNRGPKKWTTALVAVFSVVIVLSGLYLVDGRWAGVVPAGDTGADVVDTGDDTTVPPVYIPLPTAAEPGAADKLARAQAKDAAPSPGPPPPAAAEAPDEAADQTLEERPPTSTAPTSSAPAAAVAAVPPPDPPPAQLAPAATAPVVPKPAAGARCSTVLGTANVLGYVAQAGHHLAQRFQFPLSQILGRGPRTTAGSDHPGGRALDYMVFGNSGLGTAIANYALAHQRELGITYVIWQQRFNDGSGWRRMPDRGGRTANHFDHVHLSFDATPGPGLPC